MILWDTYTHTEIPLSIRRSFETSSYGTRHLYYKTMKVCMLEDIAYSLPDDMGRNFATLTEVTDGGVVLERYVTLYSSMKTLLLDIFKDAMSNLTQKSKIHVRYNALYYTRSNAVSQTTNIRIVKVNPTAGIDSVGNFVREYCVENDLGERRRRYVFKDIADEVRGIFSYDC